MDIQIGMKKKTAISIVVFTVFVIVWSIVTYQEYYSITSHPSPTSANINVLGFKETYGQSEGHNCRGPEDVYNKCVKDFNNKRGNIRANIYGNATDNIRDLFIFDDVCQQYINLQVIEEVENCLMVYEEFNVQMDQLRQGFSWIFFKALSNTFPRLLSCIFFLVLCLPMASNTLWYASSGSIEESIFTSRPIEASSFSSFPGNTQKSNEAVIFPLYSSSTIPT